MTGGAGADTTTLDGNRSALEAALSPSGRWVGAALPRKEDRRMLTGRGRFTVLDRAGLRKVAHGDSSALQASPVRARPEIAWPGQMALSADAAP